MNANHFLYFLHSFTYSYSSYTGTQPEYQKRLYKDMLGTCSPVTAQSGLQEQSSLMAESSNQKRWYYTAKLLQDHSKLWNFKLWTSSHKLRFYILLFLTSASDCEGDPDHKVQIIFSIFLLQNGFKAVQFGECWFCRHQTKGSNLRTV